MSHTIAVLGSGSWGSALAIHLARAGHDQVRLWARDPDFAQQMATSRMNAAYLPGIAFPSSLSTTHDIADAVDGASIVVAAVPSHGLRAVARAGLVRQLKKVYSQLIR